MRAGGPDGSGVMGAGGPDGIGLWVQEENGSEPGAVRIRRARWQGKEGMAGGRNARWQLLESGGAGGGWQGKEFQMGQPGARLGDRGS